MIPPFQPKWHGNGGSLAFAFSHHLPVSLIPSGWRGQPSRVRGVYVTTLIDPKWKSRGRNWDWILPSVLLPICILWFRCQCCRWESEEKELHSPPYLLWAWCRLLSTPPAQLFRLAQRGKTVQLWHFACKRRYKCTAPVYGNVSRPTSDQPTT